MRPSSGKPASLSPVLAKAEASTPDSMRSSTADQSLISLYISSKASHGNSKSRLRCMLPGMGSSTKHLPSFFPAASPPFESAGKSSRRGSRGSRLCKQLRTVSSGLTEPVVASSCFCPSSRETLSAETAARTRSSFSASGMPFSFMKSFSPSSALARTSSSYTRLRSASSFLQLSMILGMSPR